MLLKAKPYLIIPKLIEQPTWGGSYILESKHWNKTDFLRGKKIGQSYELFGQSKLLHTLEDSDSPQFVPELGFGDKTDTIQGHFPYTEDKDYFTLEKLVMATPEKAVGPLVVKRFQKMPLLIKFTQAAGNSFQLHIKAETNDTYWKSKPESWYYFENGLATLGLRKNCDVAKYKEVCQEINDFMTELSQNVRNKTMTLEEAKKEASSYIVKENPWQFVNTYEIPKFSLIDLSMGAIHHSWEEDKERFPLGNVLYEVQLDVMDPISTIRSFDQGKIKNDGSIRPLNIEDYFKHLDTDPKHNDLSYLKKEVDGSRILHNNYYSLDTFSLTDTLNDTTDRSFVHLFVKEGRVTVKTKEGQIKLSRGHSCFIPYFAETYSIIPEEKNSTVLKTYIT